MAKKKVFHIVIGRIPYDDEDSCYVIETADEAKAIEEFERTILEDSGATESTEKDQDGDNIFYINYVIRCEGKEPFVRAWS